MESSTKQVLSSDLSKKQHLKNIKQNLKSFKKKTEINKLLDDQTVFDLIVITRVMLSNDEYRDEVFKYILEYKSNEKFALLFEYLCSIRNEMNFLESRYLPHLNFIYIETSQEEKRVYSLVYLDWIINYILVNSIDYRKYLCQNFDSNKSFISTFISVLDDLDFYKKFISFYDHGIVINILNWISKLDEYRNIWKEFNSVQIILKFAQTYSKWNVYTFSIIANIIALDSDIEQLDEINQMIDEYSKYTIECINNPDSKLKQEFIDINNEIVNFEVLSLEDKQNKILNSITGFLLGLYKLAINDKLKQIIYNQTDLKDSLKKLILNGIDIEKQYAIQLLAQLSFDTEINKNLNQDKELVDFLLNLEKKDTFEYKKLKKTCENFLWILKNNKQLENDKKEELNIEQIMISYNTESRDLCHKIKIELEKLNYKVWFDVDEIHGSSLDSMATAVEESSCVLVCCTEKYRQSVNCQAEAQYAFRLNKIIIPLIMQSGYQNVKGWLGIVIGDKIFVDFTKYKFEEALKRLVKQIKLNMKTDAKKEENKSIEKSVESIKNNINKSSESVKQFENLKQTETTEQVIVEDPPITLEQKFNKDELNEINNENNLNNIELSDNSKEMNSDTTPAETVANVEININSPLNWSDDQVNAWCIENELGNFYETLKPLNGQILNQLYQLQTHTPEFFFKALTKYDSIDIKAVASFSLLLKRLFDKI